MLTIQQARALRALREMTAESGHCPSFEELRARLGYASKSSVHRVVHGLAARGMVRFVSGGGRAIEILRGLPSGGEDAAATAVAAVLRERLGPDAPTELAREIAASALSAAAQARPAAASHR